MRCFEIYLPLFNDHFDFCFVFPDFHIHQIAIVVLMVIACTNAKPAIVAPAAIAYSAPLVAAAAPVAPLPFVTATSSQVVRHQNVIISERANARTVQLLIIIYRSNRCVNLILSTHFHFQFVWF